MSEHHPWPPPSREERAAQRDKDRESRDHVLDVLNELFGGYETQRDFDERQHEGERG